MSLEFAYRLRPIVEDAIRANRAELQFALGMIGEVILETLDSFDPETARIERRSAPQAIALARTAAQVLDACRLLETSLLSAHPERCFRELALPRDRSRAALAELLDLAGRGVPDGPCVQVIWQPVPERFVYVCKARRLEPPSEPRGPLFTALQQGALLTLAFPADGGRPVSGDLASALLAVLDDRSRFPVLNVRVEQPVGAAGTAYLAPVGRMLGELASSFDAPLPPPGSAPGPAR
jgi:hypothetical protein